MSGIATPMSATLMVKSATLLLEWGVGGGSGRS